MSALRLMTFNVQMLPLIPLTVLGQSDDAEERADRVADAILSIPVEERPDVIAFNEVFNEDGRDRLKDRLAAWPNMVLKIDNGGLDNDAGLMLVSRLPFHNLPTGGELYEHFYTVAAGTDALAVKAVGIIQTNRPAEITTIAFTHLQASYDSEDEYRDVRERQLQEIFDALSAVLGPVASEWRNVILVGDLNIRGDSGAQTDEWTRNFKTSGSPFQMAFADGWRTWMHPPDVNNDPDDDPDPDRGYTNIDLETGKLQRLDYHCFTLPGVPATEAVPHHMFIRLRDQSDHFSLEAVIEGWSPNCSPSDAIELHAVATFPVSPEDPTILRIVDVNFFTLDSYQWIHVRTPGTFTVHKPPNLKVRLFLETDLSNAISPAGTLEITNLSPDAQSGLAELQFDPEGTTFSAHLPFFLAVEMTGVDPGPAKLSVFEHRGDTPATAIWLSPHASTPSGFPAGQKLGIDDICWFKASFPTTFGGLDRLEEFAFSNETGNEITVAEFDTGLQQISAVSGSQATLKVDINTPGGDERLFSIQRSSVVDAGFSCFWFSPITYLALDRPIGFFVNDESGLDWPGDDEIDLKIFLDSQSLFSGSWNSADTGERWPGLVETIRSRFAAVLPGMRRLPFVSDLTLSYVENDISASGWLVQIISPLASADPNDADRRLNLPVPDSIYDGRYTFYCSISRFPE